MDCRFCSGTEKRCHEIEEAEHCQEWKDQRAVDRILDMSEADLRAEIQAEGRDPNEVIALLRRKLSAVLGSR